LRFCLRHHHPRRLPRRDRRVDFIHASIAEVAAELAQLGGHLIVRHGDPVHEIPRWRRNSACRRCSATTITNRKRSPATPRWQRAGAAGRQFYSYKDQVIFESSEVLSQTGGVFSVFTPYKNAWLKKLAADPSVLAPYNIEPHAARLAPPPAHRRRCPRWPNWASSRATWPS
jgi:deoxyribodipyrimidine photo-lyase